MYCTHDVHTHTYNFQSSSSSFDPSSEEESSWWLVFLGGTGRSCVRSYSFSSRLNHSNFNLISPKCIFVCVLCELCVETKSNIQETKTKKNWSVSNAQHQQPKQMQKPLLTPNLRNHLNLPVEISM